MKTLSLFAALLFSTLVPASAQQQRSAVAATTCESVLAKPIGDQLDPRVAADCDSSALYFGIGEPKDAVGARVCAYIERYNNKNPDSNIFQGPGILSMIYANGEGTPRDVDLARHFVCEEKFASAAELDARLHLLDRIATAPAGTPVPHFDVCATSTSGLAEGYCASIQNRLNDARRYKDLVAIYESLSKAGQAAYPALQTAQSNFISVRSVKEIDQTGTARGAFTLQEQDRLSQQFLNDLKLIASPKFAEPITLEAANAAMETEYNNARLHAARLFVNTTLNLAGLDETQQSFLKLRDAWRAFAGIAYPQVSGDAVATQLTRERTRQLKVLNAM